MNQKRIIKNTILLYIRMLLVMGVTLYTSRIVLKVLGVEDFGIYNVVAGLATSFVFFSSSLSNSTQRYLNFELGRGCFEKIKEIFNLSLLIYFIIAVLVFLLIDIVGIWFIESKLQIPASRIYAARWVLHTFSVSLCITLMGSAFDSVLIAHENMKIYAYMGIVDAVSKLVLVYLLMFINGDKLILYSIMILTITIISRSFSAIYCFRKYPECKIELIWNKSLFGDMFRFMGWNVIGCAVYAINEQGISILLNIFFGPVVNAAKAIANQVNSAINNFTTNFFVATRPQIIQQYAAGNLQDCLKLVFDSSRYGFYLMWLICLPLILRRDYVLSLWLEEVPDYTSQFTFWILVYSLVNVLTTPLWNLIQAIGKMKSYILVGSFVYLSAFPISFALLKYGYDAVIVFQVLVAVRLLYVAVVSYIVRYFTQFSIVDYLVQVISPIILVVLFAVGLMQFINSLFSESSFLTLVVISFISICIVSLLIYTLGLNKLERKSVNAKIKKIFYV